MTHKDIYTKFMIEYDKANVTSSYPSLTEYEIATVLDKAYNALIAQKITGNNIRRVAFEGDLKAVTDLQPLVVNSTLTGGQSNGNVYSYDLNSLNLLYFVNGFISNTNYEADADLNYQTEASAANDMVTVDKTPVRLVSHDMANGFIVTTSNIPWVKEPVCYIENNTINVVYDPIKKATNSFDITYIKTPNKFAKDLNDNVFDNADGDYSYFKEPTTFDVSATEQDIAKIKNLYKFECNDTVAEELISLAITFALENVESQRLNSKLNTRGLEA